VDITLALGGGGSKGYAHIGVIRALEKEGFNIRGIAGTSAGGLTAAIYAVGFSPDEILEKAGQIRQDTLYGFGRGLGILGTKGIQQALSHFISDETFLDLRIPCALTAVDIRDKQEINLQEGKLLDALLATIAFPGIFPPKVWGEHLLVDGFVLNPIPVKVARSLAPNLPVIAVSLTPDPSKWKEISTWGEVPANPLLRPISRLRVAQAFEIYLQSMDMTSHMLGEVRLEIEKPEIIIRPNVRHIGQLDRVDPREVALLGDEAVIESRQEIKNLIHKKTRKRLFKKSRILTAS